jgi:uncharacterized repeat protein (TIGR03803 family)
MKEVRGSAALRVGVALCVALLAVCSVAGAQPAIQMMHVLDPATEGYSPQAPLIQGNDGNFYGTIQFGGPFATGTIFKMTPAGVVTILHAFSPDWSEGGSPVAGLLQAADGNFYGTAGDTVFRITPGGVFTLLHTFAGGPNDGGEVDASLIQAADGKFYGTTKSGGIFNRGTVYSMTSDGTVTILHSFAGGAGDGAYPSTPLLQTADGDFLGTTFIGGSDDVGTIFRMTPAGVMTVLHEFVQNGPPGSGGYQNGPLIQASDGNFYGVTKKDGS